jgi:hypothetical protein
LVLQGTHDGRMVQHHHSPNSIGARLYQLGCPRPQLPDKLILNHQCRGVMMRCLSRLFAVAALLALAAPVQASTIIETGSLSATDEVAWWRFIAGDDLNFVLVENYASDFDPSIALFDASACAGPSHTPTLRHRPCANGIARAAKKASTLSL